MILEKPQVILEAKTDSWLRLKATDAHHVKAGDTFIVSDPVWDNILQKNRFVVFAGGSYGYVTEDDPDWLVSDVPIIVADGKKH